MRTLKIATASLAATLALSATASADDLQTQGQVVSVTVYESSSDDAALQKGQVVIQHKKNQSTTYKWGGSTCPGKDLSDANIDRLLDAMMTRLFTDVRVRTKPGQGGAKCIVGFDVVARGKGGGGGGGGHSD